MDSATISASLPSLVSDHQPATNFFDAAFLAHSQNFSAAALSRPFVTAKIALRVKNEDGTLERK
jgi:hypothetical protein